PSPIDCTITNEESPASSAAPAAKPTSNSPSHLRFPMITKAPERFTDSTPLLDDALSLRQRAEEDGLLFFRGLLPGDLVLELRRQFLQVIARHGWLSGTPADAVANHEAIRREDPERMTAMGVGIHNEAYAQIQRLELFHTLAHHPNLLRVY